MRRNPKLIGEHTLHPTKGYGRYISLKRSRAAVIVAETKAGLRPWVGYYLLEQARVKA